MAPSSVSVSPLGGFPRGLSPRLFTLEAGDIRVALSDYGATLVSLWLRDGSGLWQDMLLGYRHLSDHERDSAVPYFGSTVGRYAGRIADSRFSLGGRTCALPANNGPHHLHGGPRGWSHQVWNARVTAQGGSEAAVLMDMVSPDGDQGYPGRVSARAEFRLGSTAELTIRWEADAEAPTPINMTSHGYFNLAGAGTVLGHTLELAARSYVPMRADLLPAGGIAPVAGTPFDFSVAKPVGRDIEAAGGYDLCYLLDRRDDGRPAARVVDPSSGRWMELRTDLPGLVFYTGEFLDGQTGKDGRVYRKRDALCLEPGFLPDSPNRPDFPSCIFGPGRPYRHGMSLRFGS